MPFLIQLFFYSLLFGQLVSVPILKDASMYLHDIVIVFAVIVFFIQKKFDPTKKRLFLPSFRLFFLSALLSLGFNIVRYTPIQIVISSLYLVRVLLYSSLYVFVLDLELSSEYWLRHLYRTGLFFTAIGSVQFVFYPFLQNIIYLGWDPHMYRAVGTLLDPNYFGLLLTLTLVTGMYLSFLKTSTPLLSIAFLGAVFFMVILTFSRSSYIACVVALLIWMLGVNKAGKNYIRGVVAFVLIGFIIITIILPGMHGEGVNIFRTTSVTARIENWKYSINLGVRHPLFGIGFNTLRYEQVDAVVKYSKEYFSHAGAGVDNSLLFVFITTGFIGCIALCKIFICMYNSLQKTLKKKKYRNISLLFASSMAAVLIHSQFTNSMFYPWILIWMFVIVGTYERHVTKH